jgi:hypothetical protein
MDGMFNSTSFGLATFGALGEEDTRSEFRDQYAQVRARAYEPEPTVRDRDEELGRLLDPNRPAS